MHTLDLIKRSRAYSAAAAALLIIMTLFVSVPAAAAPPICSPQQTSSGLDGCLPTPDECATGEFNGVWKAGGGRFAVCEGHFDPETGLGHITVYSGGDGSTVCGGSIRDDRPRYMRYTFWRDPNLCPGYSTAPGFGVKGSGYNLPVAGSGGAVASESPEAAEVGVRVLQAGGNAVDAAVATVFAVGVTRPEMCGIGGGGFLVYRSADGETAALDFRETAPAAMEPHSLEGDGQHSHGTGHGVIGVPGVVAGLAEAHQRLGSASWSSLVQPAIDLARNGIRISRETAHWYALLGGRNVKRLRLFDAAEEIYANKEHTVTTGEGFDVMPPYPLTPKLVQADYASSLELIRDRGAQPFYHGEIADLILQEMERSREAPLDGDSANASLMTRSDLASYRPIWRDALEGTYRGSEIITMPPPASGGIFTLEALNILESLLDPSATEHSSGDHLHLFAEAQKIAWADRNAYVADPDFVHVPVERLIAKEYAAERAAEVRLDTAGSYEPGDMEEPRKPDDRGKGHGHTTHVSVVDAAGNAVSTTCTIEQMFGSAVVAPGTGFLLNNELWDFGPAGTANEPEGGKRPRSSMSPTIVVQHGRPAFVVGGAGGPMIPMGVAMAVSSFVDYGMDIAHAVDAARISEPDCSREVHVPDPKKRLDLSDEPPLIGCRMWLEDGRIFDEVEADLIARGHQLVRRATHGNWYWGDSVRPTEYQPLPTLQAVGYDFKTEHYLAASDGRTDCGAAAGTDGVVSFQCDLPFGYSPPTVPSTGADAGRPGRSDHWVRNVVAPR